jgi:hypothetical protein
MCAFMYAMAALHFIETSSRNVIQLAILAYMCVCEMTDGRNKRIKLMILC